jgi:hypothetical protein
MAKISLFPLVFMAFFITLMSAAQDQYLNYQQLTTKLQSLSKNTNIKLESYGKSFGNKDLWVLKIGNDKNPALLIVGGIDGSHQSGTQMAVLMAEKIIQSNPVWLKNKSVFIIPSANPDAIEKFVFDDDESKNWLKKLLQCLTKLLKCWVNLSALNKLAKACKKPTVK